MYLKLERPVACLTSSLTWACGRGVAACRGRRVDICRVCQVRDAAAP